MRHRFFVCFFIAYCAVLVDVMVFKCIPTIHIGHLVLRFGGGVSGAANFVPFKTIVPYLMGEKGSIIDLVELLGNIVPLVPLGLLAPFTFGAMTWPRALVLGIATGLAIEALQVLFRIGIFDVDDVMLNALGVLAGYALFALYKIVATRTSPSI
ncbi:MAG TPA: VanZ family protein [Candidatus Paceibacterota bacterium]|jgi:glycopeptide antibiotics resistance protein|nr:VanZ family protein [Candidatus Paceibacterota bacterium]